MSAAIGSASEVISKSKVACCAVVIQVRPWVRNRVGRRLYVRRDDRRAWRLARWGGELDAQAIQVWRQLVEQVQPDLVIDVGANYGEVLLGAPSYPAGAAVHAVEANPALAGPLGRSLRRSGIDITLHEVAASSATGAAELHIVPGSSGLSSLEHDDDIARHQGGAGWSASVSVRSVRLDEVIEPTSGTLLFKVDVEGHEPDVLAGMAGLLGSAGRWCGLLECMPGSRALDQLDGAHVYVVRSADLSLEDATPDVVASVWTSGGRYTKDIVVSSHPLV